MSDAMNIPGSARIAAGAFVAGASLVGLAWVISARSPMPPPPDPAPVVLWPAEQSQHIPENPVQPSGANLQTPQPGAARVQPDQPASQSPAEPLTSSVIVSLDPEPEHTPEPIPDSSTEPTSEPVESQPVPADTSPSHPETKPEVKPNPEPKPAPKPEPKPDPGSAVQPIAINFASFAELQLLPRIGPVLAQRIIDERTSHGRFTSLKDLQRVKGIGVKTAAKLGPLITFD